MPMIILPCRRLLSEESHTGKARLTIDGRLAEFLFRPVTFYFTDESKLSFFPHIFSFLPFLNDQDSQRNIDYRI